MAARFLSVVLRSVEGVVAPLHRTLPSMACSSQPGFDESLRSRDSNPDNQSPPSGGRNPEAYFRGQKRSNARMRAQPILMPRRYRKGAAPVLYPKTGIVSAGHKLPKIVV